MKLNIITLFLLISTALSMPSYAQKGYFDPADATSDAAPVIKKNYFKINLTAIALKNYSAQYERALTKAISVAVAYRIMPETNLPLQKLWENAIDDSDQESKDALKNLLISNYAITPEVRFYLGKKGYGRGFYIAPFYRYASFDVRNVTFEVDDNPFTQNSVALNGKLTSNTGGLMFGAQWALGKVITLDWWIVGFHYGAAKGSLAGNFARPLSPMEQDELRKELNDLDIPLANKTVTVNANQALLGLDGPWGGLRGGICLGVRF